MRGISFLIARTATGLQNRVDKHLIGHTRHGGRVFGLTRRPLTIPGDPAARSPASAPRLRHPMAKQAEGRREDHGIHV